MNAGSAGARARLRAALRAVVERLREDTPTRAS